MKKSSLMVVGAHCDDNEISFGGTMLKSYEQYGYEVIYVQSTNNMSGSWKDCMKGPSAGRAPFPAWIKEKKSCKEVHSNSDVYLVHEIPWYHMMAQRKKEAAIVARDYFNTEPIHLDYAQRHYTDRDLNVVDLRYGAPPPDCYDPATPTIITAHGHAPSVAHLKQLILDKNPEVILTHGPIDLNPEHTTTMLLVRNAFYQAKLEGYDGSLLGGVLPRPGFGDLFNRWDAFVDTTGFYAKKKEIIGKHACAIRSPEMLDLWDTFIGPSCGNFESVEAYTVIDLSETRDGALTDELTRNHQYCNTNWSTLFYDNASKQRLEAYYENCRNQNKVAPHKTKID